MAAPANHLLYYQSTERQSLIDRFASEISCVNADTANGQLPTSLFAEFIRGNGPAVFAFMFCAVTAVSYTIHFAKTRKMSYGNKISLLIGSELGAMIIAVSAYLLPFKSMRFIYGLVFFVLFMCLHSKILSSIPEGTTSFIQLCGVFSFNTRELLLTKRPSLPSFGTIIRWICLVILTDTIIYLNTEAAPTYISDSSYHIWATALLTGYWIYISMEFHYTQSIIFCDVIGSPLPMNLRHKNPFLSISLSEFWGVRWNPVISKLLQTSFYKPLRRMGVPRVVCVAACFGGSGVLHALPVFISTRNLKSTIMMGGFFVLMGVLVLLEQAFFAVMGWNDKPTSRTGDSRADKNNLNLDLAKKVDFNMNNSGGKNKLCVTKMEETNAVTWSALFPYVTELTEMTCVAGFLYCLIEDKLTSTNMIRCSALLVLTMCGVLHVQLAKLAEIEIQKREEVLINDVVVEETVDIDSSMTSIENSDDSSNIDDNSDNSFDLKFLQSPTHSHKMLDSEKSFNSVTDTGFLSQINSRNPSFESSEKFLESTSQKLLLEATSRLLEVSEIQTKLSETRITKREMEKEGSMITGDQNISQVTVEGNDGFSFKDVYRNASISLWVLCGWAWTLGMIALLLPLFSLPVHDILDTMFPQSIAIGPLLRTLHYVGFI